MKQKVERSKRHTKKLAVVTLYSYLPALLDQTIRMAWELVRIVSANVTSDLYINEE